MSSENKFDLCRMLEWDTTFFGFRVARVETDTLTPTRVNLIDDWCLRNQIRCLYFLSRSDDAPTTRLAEDNGYHLADIRLTLEYRLALGRPSMSEIVTRLAHPSDIPVLQTIARASYEHTRFFNDPNFPRHLCSALYEAWIAQSCSGNSDTVLLAEINGEVAGYISCHYDKDAAVGKIGLMAVKTEARRQGLGQALVWRAMDWFMDKGPQVISVVTQGRNLTAQRLYQRCG